MQELFIFDVDDAIDPGIVYIEVWLIHVRNPLSDSIQTFAEYFMSIYGSAVYAPHIVVEVSSHIMCDTSTHVPRTWPFRSRDTT